MSIGLDNHATYIRWKKSNAKSPYDINFKNTEIRKRIEKDRLENI